MAAGDMLRVLFRLLLLASALSTLSCEGVAMVANVVAPEKVPAEYEIQDRVTLVLVDDPRARLGSPALAGVTAGRIAFQLKEQSHAKRVVDPQQLVNYQSQKGDAFYRTAIDRVGRDLGAEQVVYVSVEEAAVMQTGPDMFQPFARARVKVIDAESGKRLFPAAPPGAAATGGAGLSAPGHPVTVKFDELLRGAGSEGDRAILTRQLADRLGTAVAELFYKHLPPQPGEKFTR